MEASSAERLAEVVEQIVRVLETDGDAQEVLGRRRAGTLARGPVLDQALGPAEARRVDEDLQTRGGPQSRVAAAAHAEGQHAAEGGHLARRDGMARMRREPGIVHGLDRGVRLEE